MNMKLEKARLAHEETKKKENDAKKFYLQEYRKIDESS